MPAELQSRTMAGHRGDICAPPRRGTSNNIYDPVANASASVAYQMAGHGIGVDGQGLAHYHAVRAAANYGSY